MPITPVDRDTVDTLLDEEWEQLDYVPDPQAPGKEAKSDCVVSPRLDAEVRSPECADEIDLELDDLVDAPPCSRLIREDLNLIELPEMDDRLWAQPRIGTFTKESGHEEIPGHETIDPDWLARDDRLSSTIRDLTGWTLLTEPDSDERVRFPVFSDGVKTYRFGMWKILVSFHRIPGVALVDWSPESLEDDLKTATGVQPESYDVRRIARQLMEHLSPAQIQDLLAVLQTHSDAP